MSVASPAVDPGPAPSAGGGATKRNLRGRLAGIDQGILIAGVTLLMIAVGGVLIDGMFTLDNFTTMARLSSPLAILAVASAIVIMGKNVDLSVVAIVGIAGMATVQLWTKHGFSESQAIGVVVLVALAIGLLNGWMVAYVRIPALFVTLGTWKLFEGLFDVSLLDTQNYPLPRDSVIVEALGNGSAPTILALLVFLGASAFMRYTSYGHLVRATGDSPAAARLTGVPVRPLIVGTFVIAALLACLVGLLTLSISGGYSKSYGSGEDLMFNAITAAVIGGVSLTGGRGTMFGVFAGTAFIAVFVNIMTLLDMSVVTSVVIRGAILLGALALDAWLNPRDEETAKSDDL